MQIVPDLTGMLSASAGEATYRAFQWSKNYFGLAHKFASTRASQTLVEASSVLKRGFRFDESDEIASEHRSDRGVSQATIDVVQARYEELLAVDWQDAELGYYPRILLFDNPWGDFARFYPQVWMDLFSISDRVSRKQHHEFANDIDTDGYPKYYLQNFHHQTNGYLSDQSANLYDLQVELLFGGSADAMRRRVIRPMVDLAVQRPNKFTRILDVACGTGRTLQMLRGAFPQASLYGVDLSPAYLRKANQTLSEIPGELPQLLQHNAENLPFTDGYFGITTSVFLFHELPGKARQNVINEMARVTSPDGLIVICDSIQMSDSPELVESMEAFSKTFHEPYYRNYIRDNLGDRLQSAGCEVLDVQSHFMSRYTVARKAA